MTPQTWEQKVDAAMARLVAGDETAEAELDRLINVGASLAWLGSRVEQLEGLEERAA